MVYFKEERKEPTNDKSDHNFLSLKHKNTL